MRTEENGLIATPYWPTKYRGYYRGRVDKTCFWNIKSRKHTDFVIVIMYLDLVDISMKGGDCYSGEDTLTFIYSTSKYFCTLFKILILK